MNNDTVLMVIILQWDVYNCYNILEDTEDVLNFTAV